MNKLFWLKTIIDIFWFVSIPIIFFLIIGIPASFFIPETGNYKILGLDFTQGKNLLSKFFIALFMVTYLLIYFSVYKFRQVLEEFLRSKMFSKKVIKNLKVIGINLLISGILMIISRIGFNLSSESKITVDLGISAHLLCIVFGLFFWVLSEIFKTSKALKYENDLTI